MKTKNEPLVVFDLARKKFPENTNRFFSKKSLMYADIRKTQELFDKAVNRWENDLYAYYLKVKLNKNFEN